MRRVRDLFARVLGALGAFFRMIGRPMGRVLVPVGRVMEPVVGPLRPFWFRVREGRNLLVLGLIAAVVALAFAALITSLVLWVTDHDPFTALKQMVDYGTDADQIAAIINQGTTYYLSAIAVAIGFRMNLFNI